MRELGRMDFVSADVIDVWPPLDPSGVTALNAATILLLAPAFNAAK